MKHARERGYTLLELVLASALFVALLGMLAIYARSGTAALGDGTARSELDSRLRRSMARVTTELLASGLAVLTPATTPPEGSPSLTFRVSQGAVNGRISWGPAARLALVPEAGELDDGLDNDGDGLIDEGMLQWTIRLGAADEQSVILARGVRECELGETDNGLDDDADGLVDEPGLAFRREGEVLRIALTLERRTRDAELVTRRLETVVRPRN